MANPMPDAPASLITDDIAEELRQGGIVLHEVASGLYDFAGKIANNKPASLAELDAARQALRIIEQARQLLIMAGLVSRA